MNESDESILGCFVSGPATYADTEPETREILKEKGEIFCSYIWGEFGVSDRLKTLTRDDYGKDLHLALLQFYVLPILEELMHLKEIERYRRAERAIGLPIIIHDYNFFQKSDFERRRFLKQIILEKLELLRPVIRRNKLDTNLNLLKADVEQVLS